MGDKDNSWCWQWAKTCSKYIICLGTSYRICEFQIKWKYRAPCVQDRLGISRQWRQNITPKGGRGGLRSMEGVGNVVWSHRMCINSLMLMLPFHRWGLRYIRISLISLSSQDSNNTEGIGTQVHLVAVHALPAYLGKTVWPHADTKP